MPVAAFDGIPLPFQAIMQPMNKPYLTPQARRTVRDQQQEAALASFRRGDYCAALAYWQAALDMLERTSGDARAVAICLQNIATACKRLYRTTEAAEALNEALAAHMTAPPPTVREDHLFRGDCLFALGDLAGDRDAPSEAIDLLARAAEEYRRADDPLREADSRLRLGLVLDLAGDSIGAVNAINRARHTARLADHPALIDRCDALVRELLFELADDA